jgi:hypothetical protein
VATGSRADERQPEVFGRKVDRLDGSILDRALPWSRPGVYRQWVQPPLSALERFSVRQ